MPWMSERFYNKGGLKKENYRSNFLQGLAAAKRIKLISYFRYLYLKA
jgi:hypothetical protein